MWTIIKKKIKLLATNCSCKHQKEKEVIGPVYKSFCSGVCANQGYTGEDEAKLNLT